ncbi:MAG: HNH endonuclease [Armatimonadetes bacterium]|nr:HNH endonuclease [Armatimonadota bacterium]
MSTTYIPAELRRLVMERAARLCEYCLIHEDDTFLGCEVDHVVSEKHGGPTREDSLAYPCMTCNRNKGSDIASLVPGTETPVRLFHPRRDRWHDHFRLDRDGINIVARTEAGEATARILGFNALDCLLERQALVLAGHYPPPAARRLIDVNEPGS